MAKTTTSRKRRLTEVGIGRLKYSSKLAEAGPGSRMVLCDASCPSLQLRITPNGVKTFSVYFRPPTGRLGKGGNPTKGKQCRITLGQYPAVPLAEARRRANEIMGSALAGSNPWIERRQRQLERFSNQYESVQHQFVESLKLEVRTWRNAESVLRNHVEPRWKGVPLQDIQGRDATELINQLISQGRIGTAREVRKHLHRLFRWAVDADVIAANPLHRRSSGRGKANPLAVSTSAGRALERRELRAIWLASGELGYPFGPWFRLLLLTGQRRSDWAGAMRSEIKSESELEQEDVRTGKGAKTRFVLEIPAGRYKSERNHIVPLASASWEIVSALQARQGADYFLFSGRDGETPISGYSKAKKRLDQEVQSVLRSTEAGTAFVPFRIHDFRVTCRTRLSYLGISEEIGEAVLGHAPTLLSRVYNKHNQLSQKRDALERYAEWLTKVVSD